MIREKYRDIIAMGEREKEDILLRKKEREREREGKCRQASRQTGLKLSLGLFLSLADCLGYPGSQIESERGEETMLLLLELRMCITFLPSTLTHRILQTGLM